MTSKGLAKIGDLGEALVARLSFPGLSRYADPPSKAGFCLWVLGVAASRKLGPHAPDCAYLASLPDYRQLINRTAISLAQRGGTRLDDTANPMTFSESEQSKNGAGGMVPLYAARVQDLGPGDVAVFKCGACGHTAELPPSALLRGLGLKPTDKILDLNGGYDAGCASRGGRP